MSTDDGLLAWRDRAAALDATDPLAMFRGEFLIPPHAAGDQLYFCGNSLGLQPRGVRNALLDELDDWARLGVEGHFHGKHPWLTAHASVRDSLASLVGAQPSEVVAMNSLSVNLHLMMVSFFRPTAARHAILIEAGAFPSDRYAVESQLRFHGLDPARSLIELAPDSDDGIVSAAALEKVLAERGHEIALVLWPGVQYRSGQAFDLRGITGLGHAQGCIVGFDLAHAVGNIELALHDDGADFAVWCTYKYLNSGPGAVAGCFVHARHAHSDRPRFAGWWGHDQTTRFRMGPEFVPTPGADGWQLSNPPILALAPLRVSLEQFQRASMPALRTKSVQLTGMLEAIIRDRVADVLDILTPADPSARGCQLSLRVIGGRERGRVLFEFLAARGIIGDWREPDVIRISPTPMYNRYAELPEFVAAVEEWKG
ncbi:kynureninase [soil metagenome]